MCGVRKTCMSQLLLKCLLYNSLINIMEGMWRFQLGHSAAHVQQDLWAKSIFFLEDGSVAISSFLLLGLGLAGGSTRWYAGQLCFLKQRHDVEWIFASWVRVCAHVRLLWVGRMRERRRCRNKEEGKKGGSGEEMKENELGKKSKRAQKNKRAEPRSSRQPKRKCRGREKEGSGKLEL